MPQLKSANRDGTTHIVMLPLEFMQHLAALVPRPRLHLIRFHGVLESQAIWRATRRLWWRMTAPSMFRARVPQSSERKVQAKTNERPLSGSVTGSIMGRNRAFRVAE